MLQRSRKIARQEGCSPRRWITTSTERTTCQSCIDPRNVLAAQAADLPPGRGCTTHGESCTPAQIRPSPVDGIAMRAPWQRAGFHSWPSAPLLRYTKIDGPPRRSAPHHQPPIGAEWPCDLPTVNFRIYFCPLENHLMLVNLKVAIISDPRNHFHCFILGEPMDRNTNIYSHILPMSCHP